MAYKKATKVWLKKKTKRSKNGEDYEIFSGSTEIKGGRILSIKSFGETTSKKDDGEYICVELYAFKPTDNSLDL